MSRALMHSAVAQNPNFLGARPEREVVPPGKNTSVSTLHCLRYNAGHPLNLKWTMVVSCTIKCVSVLFCPTCTVKLTELAHPAAVPTSGVPQFSIVYLGQSLGLIEASIMINTSHGDLSYEVFADSIENSIRARPVIDSIVRPWLLVASVRTRRTNTNPCHDYFL